MIKVLNLEEIKNILKIDNMKKSVKKEELEIILNNIERNGDYEFLSLINHDNPLFIVREVKNVGNSNT